MNIMISVITIHCLYLAGLCRGWCEPVNWSLQSAAEPVNNPLIGDRFEIIVSTSYSGRLHDKGYTPALNLQQWPKTSPEITLKITLFAARPPPFAMKKLHPYSPRSGKICRNKGTEGYFLD